jgi:AraC-like DNA-binding protein
MPSTNMGESITDRISIPPVTVLGDNRASGLNWIQYTRLFSGMVLAQVDVSPIESDIPEMKLNGALLEFSFHISGRCKGNLSNGGKSYSEVCIGPATSLVSYNPESVWRIQMKSGERFRELNIYMPPRLLGELLGHDLNMAPANLKKIASGDHALPFNLSDSLDPAMNMIIDQITNCPHQGAVGKIYMEGKVLELLACRLALFGTAHCRRSLCKRLGPKDVDRIHEAKERLLERIDNPPSLASLARQVGLNTTKLTQGFQDVFGTSTYNLLRKERISRARRALEERRMNVTETAHHFGYSDASHFIREFVKFYGTTPGAYLKTCS